MKDAQCLIQIKIDLFDEAKQVHLSVIHIRVSVLQVLAIVISLLSVELV